MLTLTRSKCWVENGDILHSNIHVLYLIIDSSQILGKKIEFRAFGHIYYEGNKKRNNFRQLNCFLDEWNHPGDMMSLTRHVSPIHQP